MFKKLLLSFFLVLTVFMSFAPTLSPVLADDTNSTWYNQDPKDWFLKVYDPTNGSEIFGERYTAAQVQWIFYSILFIPITTTNPKLYTCMFSGDVKTCVQSVITQTNSNQSPVAQSTNKNIVQLIFQDRPFSGITYSKNVLRKFSIIPEANAQTTGFGFTALDPILSLWRGSRNIAYVLLILVTIVMAFLIMFRVKISPQVVISVQSALPKVVVAIILITFSYAIAGFLIDLMYVVIGIVSLLFTNYLGMSSGQIFNLMTTGQPTGLPVSVGVFGLVFLYLGGFTLAFISVFLSAVGGVGTSILGGAAVGVTLLTGGLVPILIL